MNYLKLMPFLFFAFLLQGAVWNNLIGGEITPDFLLVIVIILQQWLGWKEGIALGFTAGLIADVFSCGEIGINSLVYLAAPFIMQSVRGYLEIENIVFQAGYLIVFTFSAVTSNLLYSGYIMEFDEVTAVFTAKAFAIQLFLNIVSFMIVRFLVMKTMRKTYFSEAKVSWI